MKVVRCDVCGEEVDLTRNGYETGLEFVVLTDDWTPVSHFPDKPIPECCLLCRNMLVDAVRHAVESRIALMKPKSKGVSNEKN